jgi:acetolactate synthase-1/2/3 large subunit
MRVKAMRVSKVSELKEKMALFLAFGGPIVMDAIISQDEGFHPMVNPGNSLDQFVAHPFIAARNKVT